MPDIFNPSFWQDEADELWKTVSEILLDIYLSGVDGGINALPPNMRVLADYDLVNSKALEFARRYKLSWVQGIVDTTREKTQKLIGDWIASGAPLSALETALEPLFGEARAERIAVTEVTRIYATANADSWESTGLVESAVWMTARDDLVCPICGELDGTHIDPGDTDALPPAHVNCRCWIQPVVSEAALARRLAEIFT